MEDYKSMCKRIQDKVGQITEGRGFFAKYAITIDEPAGRATREFSSIHVNVDFFDDVFKVAGKLRELLNEKETKEPEQAFDIKGKRDEALMNLYRHFNDLTGDKIIVGRLGPMHEVLNAIEKLEHARHMDTSDEIAKMSIEKLEKLAAPIPEMRMSGIPKEVRAVLDKCEKKEGAKNDD